MTAEHAGNARTLPTPADGRTGAGRPALGWRERVAAGDALPATLAALRVDVIGDGGGELARATVRTLRRSGVDGVRRVHLHHRSRGERVRRAAATGRAPTDGVPNGEGRERGAARVCVAALDTDSDGVLRSLNRQMLTRGRPWLPVQLRGRTVRIGPFIQPYDGPCYECFYRRLAAASSPAKSTTAEFPHHGAAAMRNPTPGADPVRPSLVRIAAELAALEVVAYALGCAPEAATLAHALGPTLTECFVDYSPLEASAEWHAVLRLPRCPACGPRARGLPTVRAWMEPYGYPSTAHSAADEPQP